MDKSVEDYGPPVDILDVEAVNRKDKRSFFKKREPIYPKRVNGTFRRIKWIVMAITLGIYYILPWVRWDRGEGAPNQAVLVDFANSRFYFFFIELWPQEVYYITGLLILAAIGLFLVTALAGRVWCGYTCPQTVWTDLFVWVERAIEGNRNERIRLDKQPWSLSKASKKIFKHIIWLIIAIATGGAWIFYFADAPVLAQQLFNLEAPFTAYVFIGIFAFTTYSLGGLMREQVCIYMCPWPRIQSAMIDDESLAVTYRFDRGEPRAAHKKGASWDGRGDCIDCKQCVAACPMGIDIRDGLQLECIQCALCIDACDDVMAKVDRPLGLIGYDNDLAIQYRQEGKTMPFRPVRLRTVAYSIILAVVGSIMLYGLITRPLVGLNVLKDRNPTYVALSDGGVRNGYEVKILNKLREEKRYFISIAGLPGATLSAVSLPISGQGEVMVNVPGDDLRAIKVFVTLPAEHRPSGQMPIVFKVSDIKGEITATKESVFSGGRQ
ncbi:MAG: cytochrome c oxidase accessory protein CcoG [Rhodospirillaceae bacterium]